MWKRNRRFIIEQGWRVTGSYRSKLALLGWEIGGTAKWINKHKQNNEETLVDVVRRIVFLYPWGPHVGPCSRPGSGVRKMLNQWTKSFIGVPMRKCITLLSSSYVRQLLLPSLPVLLLTSHPRPTFNILFFFLHLLNFPFPADSFVLLSLQIESDLSFVFDIFSHLTVWRKDQRSQPHYRITRLLIVWIMSC